MFAQYYWPPLCYYRLLLFYYSLPRLVSLFCDRFCPILLVHARFYLCTILFPVGSVLFSSLMSGFTCTHLFYFIRLCQVVPIHNLSSRCILVSFMDYFANQHFPCFCFDWFSHYISRILFAPHIIYLYVATFDFVSEVIIPCLDVFEASHKVTIF